MYMIYLSSGFGSRGGAGPAWFIGSNPAAKKRTILIKSNNLIAYYFKIIKKF
jgi:hypothetical protein